MQNFSDRLLGTDLESEAIMTQIPPLLSVTTVEIPDSGKHTKSGNPKLQGVLWKLVDAHETDGRFAVQQVADNHVIKLQEDNRVLVVVEDDRGDMASLVQAIAESGVEIGTVASDRVSALVPISALKAIASLPEAAYVRLPLPMVQTATTSEGITVIGADTWHASGIDGDGVIVAVIDFGFTNWSSLQSSGDLPPGSRLVRRNYKSTAFEDEGQHGSAVAEIVYDAAPGVDKMILYAFDDDADIEAIVTDMIAEGVQVAAMSVGWVNSGPYDGTGYLDDQVNHARNDGNIFWAIAMGNEAQRHYEATYTPSSVPQYHQFASGANINQIGYQSAGGTPMCVFLSWNEWPTASSNYDLLVIRWTGSSWTLYYAFDDNEPTSTEGGCLNILYSTYYGVVIEKKSGDNRYLELYSFYDDYQYKVEESSLMIPADADGAVAVGAFGYTTPSVIESFSSRGPRNALGGGPWTGSCPHPNCKPEFAAPDGVSTVSYGAGAFSGTSAAAPHVAGAAALVKQAYPSYTASQIAGFLEGRAVDEGTPGDDNVWGVGRLHLGDSPPPPVGTIIVEKQTDPPGATESFEFSGDAAGSIADGEQIVVSDLLPGTYTSQEAVPSGWDLTSIECDDTDSTGDLNTKTAAFRLNAGETVKCTFTNTQRGSIIVEKQTEPDGAAESFAFSGYAAGTISDGGQIVVSDLEPGTYTSQEAVPSGWDLTSIECDDTDSTGDLNTKAATFRLDAGETVKCTFSNSRQYSAYDFDHDCDIDVVDIMAVASRWRCRTGDECYDPLYDLDDDCDIDIVDIMVVSSRWGCRCGDDCYYGTASSAISQVQTKPLMRPAAVWMEPSDSMVASGETFTVTVEIERAVDLGGFQLAMHFDPALVHVENVTLGKFLGSTGRNTAPLGPEIDNAMGTVIFGAFSFGSQPGASGDGVLAIIILMAQGTGSSPLALESVQVADTRGQPLGITVEHGRVLAGVSRRIYLPLVGEEQRP